MENLAQAFPAKTDQERKEIARKFYQNLADIIVETIKGITISKKDFSRKVKVVNMQFLQDYYDQGQTIILMGMHQANWEWGFLGTSLHLPFVMDGVYLNISSPFFQKLMLRIRGKFGANMIEKNALYKELISRKKLTRIIGLISDQGPRENKGGYWTKFLNQDTSFFIGAEKVARKMKFPVVFVYATRVKRGHYEINFKELAKPSFLPEENYIIEAFVREAEKVIQEKPEDWLWSHKRWKYKTRYTGL